MEDIAILDNPIQHYSWGSHSAIAALQGRAHPTPRPEAELWMGAHPRAPSRLRLNGKQRSLLAAIREEPEKILGERVLQRFGPELPFLFKVLAARRPLSIQAHPNREQAQRGFERENQAGIPLAAPERNYRDANHKPEIICALEPFWALKGFRPPAGILELADTLGLNSLEAELQPLRERQDREGLRQFFQGLLRLSPERRQQVVSDAVARAQRHMASEPAAAWVVRLQEEFPGDVGVLAPLFLNLVQLQPQEALFLPAGELHAYLGGVGVELMANSDNVLRGGLTEKHVDPEELLRVLTFSWEQPEILRPRPRGAAEAVYPCPAAEFELAVIRVGGNAAHHQEAVRSVEILLCSAGAVEVVNVDNRRRVRVSRGTAVLVPARVARYAVTGKGVLYKAAVPL